MSHAQEETGFVEKPLAEKLTEISQRKLARRLGITQGALSNLVRSSRRDLRVYETDGDIALVEVRVIASSVTGGEQ